MGRQEVETEMREVRIHKPPFDIEKFRRWAHDNACTLAFLAVMFAITWIMIVVANVYSISR